MATTSTTEATSPSTSTTEGHNPPLAEEATKASTS